MFPAVEGMAEKAMAVHRARGIDTSAFLLMTQEKTFPSPVSERGAEINALMKNAIESVLLGQKAAAPALKEANDKINKMLAPRPGSQ